jgi:predicted CXXCH cytochrome family protein
LVPLRLLVASLAVASFTVTAFAQMSPGPLADPHKELDTPLQCFACHGKAKGSMNDRCLDCHKDIAWLLQRDRGFHASRKADACATCHPDHAGRDLQLVRWPAGSADKFDHGSTGWPLEGKHATTKCRDCHTAKYSVSPAAKLSKRKTPAEGWIGLERDCKSCHEDIHRGLLGPECRTCHGLAAWKPATSFDHNKTDYPLTGKHAPVKCEKCHVVAGQEKPVYKPLPHAECTPCHVDPHAGRLGPACAKCHVTDSFHTVVPANFDHNKTRYPLTGKHVTVKCAQCHDPATAWGKKPPFESCMPCHKDQHAGKATILGRAIDCAACHRVEGFKVPVYTVELHQSARYPIEGRHRKVACEGCHLKNPPGVAAGSLGPAGVQLRPSFARCLDCHRDDHGGQLASRPGGAACEPCHNVSGWKPSLFGVAQHAKLKLPLEGRHAKIECAACHGPDRKGLPPLPAREALGRAGVALAVKEVDCASCHYDAHGGRFGSAGARTKPNGCASCHNAAAFRPSTVDVAAHRDFAYPLDGAHRAISCDACHLECKPAPARSSLLLAHGQAPAMSFTTKGRDCEACHETPHGDQFAQRGNAGKCASCHGEDAFKPASRFDHDVAAAFSLKGAHAHVPCAKCHRTVSSPAGRPIVVYRPVPHACEDCHGKNSHHREGDRENP